MVIREIDYINGTTAVVPNRKLDEKDKKKYEELKRSKRERQRRLNKDKKERRKNLSLILFSVLIVGVFLIGIQAKIYGMQKDILDAGKQTKMNNADSEALKIDLMKNVSLKNIQSTAESKLNMRLAAKDDTFSVDLSQNYFEALD